MSTLQFNEQRYNECVTVPFAMQPLADNLGINLSDEALRMQQLVFGIGTLLDDTFDSGSLSEQRAALYYWERLATGQTPNEATRNLVLPQLVADLDALHKYLEPSQAQTFHERGRKIIALTDEGRGVSNARAYHRLRASEAQLAFELVVSTIPLQEQTHPRFTHYVQLGGLVGRIAGAIDGVTDLRSDAREKRTAVPPTLTSHMILSCLACKETINGLNQIGWRTMTNMAHEALKTYTKRWR